MAIRELLHINKLDDLRSWLEEQGYMILPTSRNQYEVLRAKKGKDTIIIYKKANNREHLSVMDKDYALIRKFIGENKRIREAEEHDMSNRADEECFISNGETYPLCKGKGEQCHECCLYENYEEYNSPY